ncbi:hypothetical protein G7068_11605 [Leucobacter viscericola]|uniref:Uncharacterized protein n=1 Tax=Leucobacter viscericola TaxID=2714935 RepID=A0A6G7XH37_9MICO|nr:hypothetical protein [Leucobacter viscericola]QIK63759.1 hypothetical protein G7068_11605 [Leucobacter viscericola]
MKRPFTVAIASGAAALALAASVATPAFASTVDSSVRSGVESSTPTPVTITAGPTDMTRTLVDGPTGTKTGISFFVSGYAQPGAQIKVQNETIAVAASDGYWFGNVQTDVTAGYEYGLPVAAKNPGGSWSYSSKNLTLRVTSGWFAWCGTHAGETDVSDVTWSPDGKPVANPRACFVTNS